VATGGYPPPGHFLGDVGFDTEVLSDTEAVARTRVTPFVCGADGGARAGVLATLVDVVGGLLGVRILRPDWMATADLTLQLARPAVGPVVEARASLVRRGRTTMVLEALVIDVDDAGHEVLGADGLSAPAAWSTLTFAVLPGGNRTAAEPLPFDLPPTMSIRGVGLDRPLVETLGITVDDAAAGRVSLPVHPYVYNSIEAVQGGVMALLGEVAAAEALGAAAGRPGASMVITDLQVAYLTLGRVGPIVTRTAVLDTAGPDGATGGSGSAVVELIDSGAEDRLTTVINARGMAVEDFVADRGPTGSEVVTAP
jgi:acyl-coenzyme A thioesterase PaaI-like protein